MMADLGNTKDWRYRAAVGWRYVWGGTFPSVQHAQAATDSDGKPYAGKNRYRIHFSKDQLIPARHWRITMYDNQGFMTDNPLHRYGIGNIADPMQYNKDGSLDLYFGPQAPQGMEKNWVKTMQGKGFFPMFRIFGPQAPTFDGSWKLNDVAEVK